MKVAASILFTLLLLEILVRIFDPIDVGYFIRTKEYFSHTVPHSKYSYTNPPNKTIEIGGVTYRFNSLGMRGAEVTPKDGKRVLVLGDSIVLGWGVDTTASEYLQRMTDWEVLSMGTGSWTTKDEVEWFLDVGHTLHADLVIVIVCENDTDERLKPSGWAEFKGKVLYSSYLLLTIKRVFVPAQPSKLDTDKVMAECARMKPYAKKIVGLRYSAFGLERYRLSKSDAHANTEGQKVLAGILARELE